MSRAPRSASSSTAMYTRLAIPNPAGSRLSSASASRTTWTCSAYRSVVVGPAPKKPSPWRTARRRPARLHQPQPLVEPGDQPLGVDAERGELPASSPGAHTDLEASLAELVQRGDALGEVERAVQRGDEHRAAQAQPFGTRGRVRQGLDRSQGRDRAEELLLCPGAGEAELLGAGQVGAEGRGVEGAVGGELRD